MKPQIKNKSWVWYLTFPFAHNNVTAWNGVIYKPKNAPLHFSTIEHEKIHLKQQETVGKWKFLFLYLFALPLLYNPWRYKWESEAYTSANGLSNDQVTQILKSYRYGWLHG